MDELQQTLLKDDCYIPGIRNTDEKDLARTATVTATSAKEGFGPEQVINGISRGEGDERNIWVSDGMSENGETLTLKLKKAAEVSQVRLTFDSNFNYAIKISMSGERQGQQRIGTPVELAKDYTVELYLNGEKVSEKAVVDNVQRANVVDLDKTLCDEVKVKIHSTNGAADARVYEVRIY